MAESPAKVATPTKGEQLLAGALSPPPRGGGGSPASLQTVLSPKLELPDDANGGTMKKPAAVAKTGSAKASAKASAKGSAKTQKASAKGSAKTSPKASAKTSPKALLFAHLGSLYCSMQVVCICMSLCT